MTTFILISLAMMAFAWWATRPKPVAIDRLDLSLMALRNGLLALDEIDRGQLLLTFHRQINDAISKTAPTNGISTTSCPVGFIQDDGRVVIGPKYG